MSALENPETMAKLIEDLNHTGRFAADAKNAASLLKFLCTPRPLDEWDEDHGPVTWWAFPVCEPSWIGKPDDSDWPGYHTHWTPHPPIPQEPK